MKFDVAYVLHRVTPSRCAEIFFDARFAQAMKAVARTRSLEEIERRDEGTRVHRRTRVVPDRAVPAPLRPFVRGEMALVEEATFDREALAVDWRSVPTLLTERLELSGRTTFRAVDGTSVERRIVGEVHVRVAAVGGMVERLLVDDLRATQGRIVDFAQRWIDDGL